MRGWCAQYSADHRALIILATVVLQIVLALVGFGIPAVGALHGVNALVIYALAIVAGAGQ